MTSTRMKVTPYYKNIMCTMRESGLSYKQIKNYLLNVYKFSVSRRTILYHTNDEWRDKELQRAKDKRAERLKDE